MLRHDRAAGNRLRRRRALSLAIGWFAGLVLSGAWTHKEVFWWPAFGFDRPDAPLLPPWPVVVVLELLGLAAAWWIWVRFGLADPARRTRHAAVPGRLASSVRGCPTDDRVRAARADRRQPRRPVPGPRRPAAHRRGPRAGRTRSPTLFATTRITRVVSSPLHRVPSTPRRRSPRRHGLAVEQPTSGSSSSTTASGTAGARATSRRTSGRAWRADHDVRAARRRVTRSRSTARVAVVLRRARSATSSIVAVSHVSPIKAAVCWALGVDDRGDLAHVPRPRVRHADRPAGRRTAVSRVVQRDRAGRSVPR